MAIDYETEIKLLTDKAELVGKIELIREIAQYLMTQKETIDRMEFATFLGELTMKNHSKWTELNPQK